MKIRALFNFKIDTIIKFIWQNVINRHEYFDIAILNEDFENKKIIKQLLQKYRIKIKIVSFYYSMINDMIKRNHQFIVDALSKLINDKFEMWFQHLHAILWINRIIVRDSINIIFFRLFYEWDAVLFIEIKYFTWHMMNWNKIQSIENLLTLRARQLKRKDEDFEKMTLHLRRMREQNKEFFNDKHQLRRISLNMNNLMLRHNIKFNNKHDFKLTFRWNESFRMREVDSIKKIYVLKKMNEVRLNETYAENRLKYFRIWKVRVENVEKKKIDLTKSLKNIEKFEKMIEIVEKNFEENFEMRKENFN